MTEKQSTNVTLIHFLLGVDGGPSDQKDNLAQSNFIKLKTSPYNADIKLLVICQVVFTHVTTGLPGGARGKEPTCQSKRYETWVQYLGWEDTLEEGTATHTSVLAWRISWTEEPGRQQSTGFQRVRYN